MNTLEHKTAIKIRDMILKKNCLILFWKNFLADVRK